ncbi:MAG: tetratricopeptide repeat protein [Treponemataceae bacterium]
MKNCKKGLLLFLLSFVVLSFLTANTNLHLGMEAYSKGDFSSSILYFEKALDVSGGKNEDAQYWLVIALTSSKKFPRALSEARRFLALYPNSKNTPEMLYQKGRLECGTGAYDEAISTLYDFIKKYPNNKAIASAYFWIGESLYNTGRFNEARTIFSVVLLDYPNSAKIEATKYKLALIDQASTQAELLRLLKLSNEETLRLSQEVEKLKAELAQAKNQAKGATSSKVDSSQISELEQYLIEERRKNADLYDKITLLQMKNDELSQMIANFANKSYLDEKPTSEVPVIPVEPTPPVVEKPKEEPTQEAQMSEEELKRRLALEELLRKAGILKNMYDEVLEK